MMHVALVKVMFTCEPHFMLKIMRKPLILSEIWLTCVQWAEWGKFIWNMCARLLCSADVALVDSGVLEDIDQGSH